MNGVNRLNGDSHGEPNDDDMERIARQIESVEVGEFEIDEDQYGKSDVKLITNDGNEFFAHKAVLSLHSDIFYAVFQYEGVREDDNYLSLSFINFSYDVVRAALEFFYTRRIRNLRRVCRDLLRFAVNYEANTLKNGCEHFIVNNLTPREAPEVLIFAHHHRLDIKSKIIKYITDHLNEVAPTPEYQQLNSFYPEVVRDLFRDAP